MKFNGTILITDPCYIHGVHQEDMEKAFYYAMPSKKGVDYGKAKILDLELNFTKRFYSAGKDEKLKNHYLDEIRRIENEIAELHKEKNLVDVIDWNKQATNFLNEFGFTDCIWGNTLYGDWSCHVFNADTKEPIGRFCADGGMFCVMYLEEVLKYNPAFDYHISKPWTSAIIENFDGDIEVKVVETKFMNEGKEEIDESIEIHGKGNINFVTKQTGF